MNPATLKAITMMGIALPTMFFVIGIFILATKALHSAFPATEEAGDEDDD